MLSPEDFELVQADLRKNNYTPPSRLSQLRTFITGLTAGTGMYFASLPLWLDASGSYQPVIKYGSLKGRAFVGMIHKAGEVDDTAGPDSWLDKTFVNDCQGAYDADMAYAGYVFTHCGAWWLNHGFTMEGVEAIDSAPNDTQRMRQMLTQDPEFALIVRQWAIGDGYVTNPDWLKTASFRKVYEWELDGERWWRSYNQYLAYLRGQADISAVKPIEPPWIAFSNRKLYERLDWAMMKGYLPRVPVVSYTGKWFINQYSPDFGAWLGSKETHPAIYYWGAGGVTTTVEELATVYMTQIPDTWKDTSGYRNAMFGTPRFVQISGDRYKIPEITNTAGAPTAIDVNVYVHGQDWKTWLNFGAVTPPTPDPEPEPSPDLAALTARVVALEDKLTAGLTVTGVAKIG
jgi:hypothetical protein